MNNKNSRSVNSGKVHKRRAYLDNLRWITVELVIAYHVFYLFNGVGVLGSIEKNINPSMMHYYILYILGLCVYYLSYQYGYLH